MDIDVRALMLTLLETQKGYVVEQREQYGEAMVATFPEDNQSFVMFPIFEDEQTKIAEYAAVVERARRDRAVLIITVNAGRQGRPDQVHSLDDYRWGDFYETNSLPCILLTASGPGLQSCSLDVGYSLSGNEVEFEEHKFMYDVDVKLLPDWP